VSEGKSGGLAPARTTVLVLNYNGREHLEECLGSLGTQDVFVPGWPGQPREAAARDEVWLVDNASTDGSAELLAEKFPWVRVVSSDSNIGFSRAYNRAAAMCGSEYVVFLNNDARVGPEWLSTLHRARQAHPEAKALACRIMSWDGTRVDFAGADTFFSGPCSSIARRSSASAASTPITSPSSRTWTSGGGRLCSATRPGSRPMRWCSTNGTGRGPANRRAASPT
jgi:GT2 family glycosyltransferase